MRTLTVTHFLLRCLLVAYAGFFASGLRAETSRDLPSAMASTPSFGRFAVILVIDGLGDGNFQRLRAAGDLPLMAAHFASFGQQANSTSSLWPSTDRLEFLTITDGYTHSFEELSSADQSADQSTPSTEMQRFEDGLGRVGSKPESAIRQLIGVLPRPGAGLPPKMAVCHLREYARAVTAGANTAELKTLLRRIDADFADLLASYAALGLEGRSAFVLFAPSGVQPSPQPLGADVFREALMPKSQQRRGRLSNLLHAFAPISVQANGALALFGPKLDRDPKPGAENADLSPSSAQPSPVVQDLWRACKQSANRGERALKAIVARKNVDFVVVRTAMDGDDAAYESLRVIGESGEALLQIRDGEALRYRVLRQKDPLHLTEHVAQMGTRFHHESLWGGENSQPTWALARVARLLDLDPRAAMAVVAKPGFVFAGRGWSASRPRQAQLYWSGLGAGGLQSAMPWQDLTPTLRALVGLQQIPGAEGEVMEGVIEQDARSQELGLGLRLLRQVQGAFSAQRRHETQIIDTSEMRRFGTPPQYFSDIEANLDQLKAADVLPSTGLRAQMGSRRSLLAACVFLQARIQKQVVKSQPHDLGRFDNLLRPERMLTRFLAQPDVLEEMHILEGPQVRAHNAALRMRQLEQQ